MTPHQRAVPGNPERSGCPLPTDDDAPGTGTFPLTPATALLFSNMLPPAQVPQQTLTEAGELINPLPPIAAELHETYR